MYPIDPVFIHSVKATDVNIFTLFLLEIAIQNLATSNNQHWIGYNPDYATSHKWLFTDQAFTWKKIG